MGEAAPIERWSWEAEDCRVSRHGAPPGIREVLAIHAVVTPINDGERRCLPSAHGRCGRSAEQGFGAVMRQASKIGHMLVTNTLVDLRARTRRDVTIEIVQPDRLEIDLDGLMEFRAASSLLTEGECAAETFLASRDLVGVR